MPGDRLELKFWGTRGSLPTASPECSEFGGCTMCVELRYRDKVILFDAGSGLPIAGKHLWAEGKRDFHLFFTHGHYDHIMGLPFFLPVYKPEARLTLWSGHREPGLTTAGMVADFMREPFFPVGPEAFKAEVEMRTFTAGETLQPCEGVTMRTAMLNHPGGAVGYRVECAGKTVAMVFDTEHHPGSPDPVALDLMRGADLVLYDSNFTDAEFDCFRHFGHSTWQEGIRLAQLAGAKRIALVHHSTFRTDGELLAIEAEAKKLFPGAFCARDFQTITV